MLLYVQESIKIGRIMLIHPSTSIEGQRWREEAKSRENRVKKDKGTSQGLRRESRPRHVQLTHTRNLGHELAPNGMPSRISWPEIPGDCARSHPLGAPHAFQFWSTARVATYMAWLMPPSFSAQCLSCDARESRPRHAQLAWWENLPDLFIFVHF